MKYSELSEKDTERADALFGILRYGTKEEADNLTEDDRALMNCVLYHVDKNY